MKQDESSELTREEAVSRWTKRQEQDQARFEKLESEPWRFSKRIKEQDRGQRLVVTTPLTDRLWGIIFFAVFTGGGVGAVMVWSLPLYSAFLLVAGMVCFGLFMLGLSTGTKTVIDKPTESITMESRPFLLLHRQRVIPFSAVMSVVIDYERSRGGEGGSKDWWQVSLNAGGEKVKIDQETNRDKMFALARGISTFIKKEIEVNSDKKPESDILPTNTFDRGKLPPDWKL